MPARTTVISVLSKRGDKGIAPLAASTLLQMAGRAGRRGMDEIGHVVLCRSPFEDAATAHSLLLQVRHAASAAWAVRAAWVVLAVRANHTVGRGQRGQCGWRGPSSQREQSAQRERSEARGYR